MSRYVDKVTHKLDLSDHLESMNNKNKRKTLEEVGQYLVEQILENCGKGQTSVAGGRWKKSLSPAYKKTKGGLSSSSFANMELTGEMLDALDFKVKGDEVEVGIFDYGQAQKADNHNKFSEASKSTSLPARQFIPNKDEKFKKDIMNEVLLIIKEASDA